MPPAPKPKLGDLLVSAGILDELQVKAALARQQRWGGKFGENVVALEFCDAETINRVLAKQLGVKPVEIRKTRIDLTLLTNFPKQKALEWHVLPLSTDGKSFTVAAENPKDNDVMRDVEFRLGKRLNVFLADGKALTKRIEQAYRAIEQGDSELEPDFDEADSADMEPRMVEQAPAPAAPPPRAAAPRMRVVPPPKPETLPEDLLPEDAPETSSGGGEELLGEPDPPPPAPRPVPPPAPAAMPAAAPVASAIAGKLILIVDTDDDIRRVLRLELRRHGYKVVETGDGLQVVDLIKSHRPNLLMIDLSTQDVAGIEMCRKLKSSQSFADVPIVLTSGQFNDWRSRDDLMELTKASAFLPKPLDLHLARVTVGRLLEHGSKDVLSASEQEAKRVAESLVKTALELYETGDYARAIPLFVEAADYNDSDGNIYYYLAEAYTAAGQKYKSLGAYEKAVDRMQDSFLVLKKLAVAYEKLGFKRKAYEAFERSARVCPNPQLKQKILAYMNQLM